MIVIFGKYTLKHIIMARNIFDIYLEELENRKVNLLNKLQKEYKVNRLKKCLEVLKRANSYHTIPSDIISKIDLIFELMPSHELYYIQKDEVQFQEYIKELNSLFIRVLDDYEDYIEEWENTLKRFYNILFPLIFLVILFYDKFQKRIGASWTIILASVFAIILVYVNRKKIWHNHSEFH
jgi:membrane protein insertase Oxa1/YidC/SpoIIIJ